MMQLSPHSLYNRICKKILEIDDIIRFAGVINENGRLIVGAAKENVQFYVKEEDREMLFMEAALRTKMLCEFDSSLGPNNFSMYNRKNVIILEFPTGNETIYVSTEIDFEPCRTPFKIIQAIRDGNAHNNFVSTSN